LAAGWLAGHPFWDSLPNQVTVTEYDWPGSIVWTCGCPPGKQSSDDQIRVLPEVMTSSFCGAPTSRLHGLLDVFWILMRSRGVAPTT
jgi:hypothetical protein